MYNYIVAAFRVSAEGNGNHVMEKCVLYQLLKEVKLKFYGKDIECK